MVLFLKRAIGLFWGFLDSMETSSLKKKLTKHQKTIEEHEESKKQLEADIESIRSELNTSFSDRDDSETRLRAEIASLKMDRETLLENNRALREKQERLELDLAKANATLLIRQEEKTLMAELVKFHREEVRMAIVRTTDSYADHDRPSRSSEQRFSESGR